MSFDLKIGARLALGFSMLVFIAATVGLFGLTRMSEINSSTHELATDWLAGTRSLGKYQNDMNVVRRAEILAVLARDHDEYTNWVKLGDDGKKSAARDWAEYVKTVSLDEERQHVTKIHAATEAYYVREGHVLELAAQGIEGRQEALTLYSGGSREAFFALLDTVQAGIDFQARGANDAYARAESTFASAKTQTWALIAIALGIGLITAWRITVSITKPLNAAVDVAKRVAAGDLHRTIRVAGSDETAQLLRALSSMQKSLVDVVAEVRSSSDSIATGSAQIAVGNADLSQRTEEQASNLQQTAASVEQLTSTVKQNADSTQAAMELARDANVAAESGRLTVDKVVTTISQIDQASRKVSDIIGVIDGIAFQTNILALNAAVEAARAGEQGRGFAVVASEVRALAHRSSAAAKEIKALIEVSAGRVLLGTELAMDAGNVIAEIASKVSRVNAIVGEIASASAEQTSGISQVANSMNQLDQVTQQNAALVEEGAAAAESLKAQADRLAELMEFFKL